MPNAVLTGIAASALFIMSLGEAAAQAETRASRLPSKVSAIYVADFELKADEVKEPSGVLPGPVGRFIRGGPDALKSPEQRAHELVDLMARTLTNTLINEGINAHRLPAGARLPAEGWLIRGVFIKVDAGNRLERAAIGLGAGETHLNVVVTVDDLKAGVPTKMEEILSGAHSSKMLGAGFGAVIRLNPAAVAAKFALSGIDVERNVVKTALDVATQIAAHARQ